MSRPAVPAAYRALIGSPRVSTGTRAALLARDVDDDPDYHPVAMTPAQLGILRAVVRRLVPQREEAAVDLAARLDAQLGGGPGDGWRFAKLPDDRTAYAQGLSVLDGEARARHGLGFADLADDLQDAMLSSAAAGELDGSKLGLLDGAQMRLWFEEVLTDAVRLYVAHPATLARIGYSGIGCGGDGPDKPGFKMLGLGEREPWEPLPETPEDAR
jgi:hypothetical protein